MAFIHGKAGFFSIDDATPTVRDISVYISNVDFTREADNPETTTFTKNDRTFIAGLIGSNFSISGFWDPTVTTGPDEVLNGILGSAVSSTFVYGPEGNTAGDITYTGECFESSYNISGSVDGVVEFTADFTITDAITRITAV